MKSTDSVKTYSATPLTRWIATLLHRIYKATLSPLIGQECRFEPTCSDYALEALHIHGFVRGVILAAKRFFRCHPFNPGGVDPVPPRDNNSYDNN